MTEIADPAETPSVVEIRRALPEDSASISAILYQAFVEYQTLYTPQGFAATVLNSEQVLARMQEGRVWIACRDREPLATVATVIQGDVLYIRGMAVLPKARGMSIASRLLRLIEGQAIQQGCGRLLLSTTPFLHSAIRLYERFGFQRQDTRVHDLFGTPLFTMEKKVSSNA